MTVQKAKDHRYLQIAKDFESQITNKTFRVGDVLPTEKEICEKFSVSRYTARSALQYLIDLQFIERRQGFGSVVVANKPYSLQNSFMQDLDDLWQYGNTTRFKIFACEELIDCSCFGKIDAEKAIHLKGQRFTKKQSETPFCISDVFLWTTDSKLHKRLLNKNTAVRSLMDYLCPENLSRVEQILSAREMTREEKKILTGCENKAVLCIERKYYDHSGRHIASAINVHSSSQYHYATVLHQR